MLVSDVLESSRLHYQGSGMNYVPSFNPWWRQDDSKSALLMITSFISKDYDIWTVCIFRFGFSIAIGKIYMLIKTALTITVMILNKKSQIHNYY